MSGSLTDPTYNYLLKPDSTFLEVVSGDCSLSLEIAKHVRKVCAVDVSDKITKNSSPLEDFELIIFDDRSISVMENSVNIIYSHCSKPLIKGLNL